MILFRERLKGLPLESSSGGKSGLEKKVEEKILRRKPEKVGQKLNLVNVIHQG